MTGLIFLLAVAALVLLLHMSGWGILGLMAVLFLLFMLACVIGLLHYRHKHAELREREADPKSPGQWRRQHNLYPWPKICQWCSTPIHTWRAAGVHQDPDRSACAAHRDRIESRQAAELRQADMQRWEATIVSVQHGGDGEGSVDMSPAIDQQAALDTFTDDPDQSGDSARPTSGATRRAS